MPTMCILPNDDHTCFWSRAISRSIFMIFLFLTSFSSSANSSWLSLTSIWRFKCARYTLLTASAFCETHINEHSCKNCALVVNDLQVILTALPCWLALLEDWLLLGQLLLHPARKLDKAYYICHTHA